MNEAIRMEYMEALGIDMYVPRRVLPTAKPSVQALLPIAKGPFEEAPDVVAEDASRAIEQAVAKSPSQLAGIIGQLEEISHSLKPGVRRSSADEAPTPVSKRVSEDQQAIDTASSADKMVRFCLNIWQLPGLLVVDSHLPRAALPTTQLLSNILKAKAASAALPHAEMLKWPVLAHEKQGSLVAAREMLESFIKGRLDGASNCQCWLLGQAAFEAIAPLDMSFEERLGQSFSHEALGMFAVCLPSLAHMLKTPSIKALTWRAIKDIPLPKALIQ